MSRIMIAGTGTDVGKTVVAAILATLLKGDYWKPIQCGNEKNCDTAVMRDLIDPQHHKIYLPAYSFNAPLSPHQAASLKGISIDIEQIRVPETNRHLIIEGVGGIYVPLTKKNLTIDLFRSWDCQWIIVSKHYLGSINHTLLTYDALKRHQLSIAGIIFNGIPTTGSEEVILEMTELPLLGRLCPETKIDRQIIQRYAKKWQSSLPMLQ